MEKLALDLDELRVESFATVDVDGSRRGTVRAAEDTLPTEFDCHSRGGGCTRNCTNTTCNTEACTVAPYC